MHFFNCFSCIQSLRLLGIISTRPLPVESFLDHAGSFCLLVCAFFALHAARSSSLFAFPSAYHFPLLPTTPYIKTSVSAELRVPIVMPQKVYPGKKVVLY